MSAHPATVEQLGDYFGEALLTPRGWSDESKQLAKAEVVSLGDFFDVPASRIHLHAGDDHQSVLRIVGQDLRNVLAMFRGRLSDDMYHRIHRRVATLINPAEWDTEDELPNIESFWQLVGFLATHKGLRVPSIFLNRYGLFTASWRPERRKLTSLVFHPDGMINWLVFSPTKVDDDETIEIAGRAPAQLVLEEVGKHGALEWMKRPSVVRRLFAYGRNKSS
jgi:hypothetical protein